MNIPVLLTKSPVDPRDWVAETIFNTGITLPKTFTTVDNLQPVRNQGSLSTCAAQTASCMKEWQERIDVCFDNYMSPMFIYNNRSDKTVEGMFSRDVMDILNKKGICPESVYPYGSTADISPYIYDIAKKYTIKGYAAVNTIDTLKQALIQSGPCYIAVPVYNYGNRMWKPVQNETMIGGHAMTVVGYNTNGFIIRNTWGSSWNATGYTIFLYEDWGLQWEVWTAVDEKSGTAPVEPKSSLLTKIKKIFNAVLDWFGKVTTV